MYSFTIAYIYYIMCSDHSLPVLSSLPHPQPSPGLPYPTFIIISSSPAPS